MILLSRAPIWRGNAGMDVTRKSGEGLGLQLAPSWELINGIKSGSVTEYEYSTAYCKMLDELPDEVWDVLSATAERQLTFLCYCRDGAFCHTYILMNYLINRFPDQYGYWR